MVEISKSGFWCGAREGNDPGLHYHGRFALAFAITLIAASPATAGPSIGDAVGARPVGGAGNDAGPRVQ